MKRIYLGKNIKFSKCQSGENSYQRCVFCNEIIGKGNIGISLMKKCENRVNVWLHIKCVEQFCKELPKWVELNKKFLLVETLQK